MGLHESFLNRGVGFFIVLVVHEMSQQTKEVLFLSFFFCCFCLVGLVVVFFLIRSIENCVLKIKMFK